MRAGASALSGIWSFPLTPFLPDDGRVDHAALAQSVDNQISGGATAVVAGGMVAEAESLTVGELRDITATVASAVDGRTPLVVSVPSVLARAVPVALLAAEVGAYALLVMPPLSSEPLPAYLERLGSESGLPLILYQRANLRLEPDELARLVDAHALIGIKDGQRDLAHFRRLRSAFADELIFVAAWEDLVLPYWALGADAFAPASMTHDPWYARCWYEALARRDVGRAREVLAAFAYAFTDLRLSRPGIDVAVLKYAMSLRELGCYANVRRPGRALTAEEQAQVGAHLRALDALQRRW